MRKRGRPSKTWHRKAFIDCASKSSACVMLVTLLVPCCVRIVTSFGVKYISGHAHKIVSWYLLVILFKISFFNMGFSPLNTEDYTFSMLQSDQWFLSVLPKVRFLNKRYTPLKNVRSEPFILRTKSVLSY